MRAEIVSVGTELLLGHIVDTNAAYLAQELSALGIDLFWESTVGDNLGRLVEVVRRAHERSDLTIITGGVGPTEDDLTREAIAETLGEKMTVDPELETTLRAFFARRNRPMPERNVKQATLIPSARTLPNPIGTAPGWYVEKNGHVIVTMPGVPVEMFKMWSEQVAPRLLERERSALFTRILKVLGIGESHAEEMIQSLLASTNPTIATYAKNDGVHVRITAKAPTLEQAKTLLDPMERSAREILGENIYGVDGETLESIVIGELKRRCQTLATIEGVTGGLIASAIIDAPDSAETFTSGQVANSPAQMRLIGIDEEALSDGPVSERAARALATLARQKTGATVGLAILGVGGPEPISNQRPGTLQIALDYAGEVTSESLVGFGNTRGQIKIRAALSALDYLRRYLGAKPA